MTEFGELSIISHHGIPPKQNGSNDSVEPFDPSETCDLSVCSASANFPGCLDHQEFALHVGKRRFLDEWIGAVNQHMAFGRWHWAVSKNAADLPDILERHKHTSVA